MTTLTSYPFATLLERLFDEDAKARPETMFASVPR